MQDFERIFHGVEDPRTGNATCRRLRELPMIVRRPGVHRHGAFRPLEEGVPPSLDPAPRISAKMRRYPCARPACGVGSGHGRSASAGLSACLPRGSAVSLIRAGRNSGCRGSGRRGGLCLPGWVRRSDLRQSQHADIGGCSAKIAAGTGRWEISPGIASMPCRHGWRSLTGMRRCL